MHLLIHDHPPTELKSQINLKGISHLLPARAVLPLPKKCNEIYLPFELSDSLGIRAVDVYKKPEVK
jgi:hypothetical protein